MHRRVESFTEGGQQIIPSFDADFIRVHPTRIVSWGIDSDAFHPNNRAVG